MHFLTTATPFARYLISYWAFMIKKNDKSVSIEIHVTQPHDFNALVEVAACYIEIDGKLLLLERASHKLEGNAWGVPAGKLEKDESPQQGARRELFEETGIDIQPLSKFQSLATLYIRKPEVDYVYHMFEIVLEHMPKVHLSDEHLNYAWVSQEGIQKLRLMAGALETLKHYHQHSFKKRDLR